ncbi:hypothetical protein ACWD25_57980 [Streptomyces sp. NPDC002920]
MPWNDLSRGAVHQTDGPDEDAERSGINPVASGVRTEDEFWMPAWADDDQLSTRTVTISRLRGARLHPTLAC